MIKSKFKSRAYLPVVMLIAALLVTVGHLIMFKRSFTGSIPGKIVYFIMGMILFSLISKVRTKTVKVSFANNIITVKQVLGLGQKHQAWLADVTGYYTSTVSNRYKEFDYIYIMQGKRKIAKISTQYHSNYNDMAAYVKANFRYLGNYKTTFLTEITDLLKQ